MLDVFGPGRARLRGAGFGRYQIVLGALLLWLGGGSAWACSVCIPYPDRTVVDRIGGAAAVVVAAEDPERPFHFRATAVLKGSEVPPVDLLIDSRTLAWLRGDPAAEVILVLDPPPRPAPLARLKGWRQQAVQAPWVSLGPASADIRRIVDFALGPYPKHLEDRQRAVAELFLPLLAHGEDRIADIAYLEIARLPYSTLRELSWTIDGERIRSRLSDPLYYEWRGLYIYALGLSADAADHDFVRRSLVENARLGVAKDFHAWLVALAEFEDESAVDWIEERTVAGELDHALMAEASIGLSIIGTARPDLRPRIRDSYKMLLKAWPQLVGFAARDMLNWSDRGLVSVVREIVEGGEVISEDAALLAEAYLRD